MKKEELRGKLHREPTLAEILKKCKTSSPKPAVKNQGVWTVLSCMMAQEAQKHLILWQIDESDTTTERPKMLFKHNQKVFQKVCHEQLRHVDCNCLSDEDGIPIM